MQITTDSITTVRSVGFIATIIELSITETKVDPDFAKGYQDAAELKWETFPTEMTVDVIDAYRAMAVQYGSKYIAGIAQGAWDLFVSRELVPCG